MYIADWDRNVIGSQCEKNILDDVDGRLTILQDTDYLEEVDTN